MGKGRNWNTSHQFNSSENTVDDDIHGYKQEPHEDSVVEEEVVVSEEVSAEKITTSDLIAIYKLLKAEEQS